MEGLTEYMSIPVELLKELHQGLVKIEEVTATLEELMNKEGIKRIRESEEEYKKGEFTIAKDEEEIRKIIK